MISEELFSTRNASEGIAVLRTHSERGSFTSEDICPVGLVIPLGVMGGASLILSPPQTPRDEDEATGGVMIPGKGETTNPEGFNACGTVRFWQLCSADPSHKGGKPRYNHCDAPGCPECWPYWSRKETDRIAARVEGFLQARRDQADLDNLIPYLHRPSHWYLSPPPGLVREAIVRSTDTGGIIDLLRKWGREQFPLEGGAVIFHPYRMKKGDDEPERWRVVRDLPDWQDHVYFSPHFHIIGYGALFPDLEPEDRGPAFFVESQGWRLWKVRDLPKPEDVRKVASYLLSHTFVLAGKNAVSYWGCLSSRYLKCTKAFRHKDDILCPECSAVMMYYDQDQAGRLVPTGHYATCLVIERHYSIVKPPPAIESGASSPRNQSAH